jgi:hypothetical protein
MRHSKIAEGDASAVGHWSPEPTDEVQYQRQYNAYDNAGHQGKIKGKILFFDQDIARKLADKWYPVEKIKD